MTIARVFLAVILLRGAFACLFGFTFRNGAAFLIQLILGTAIAAGWLVRYAAALVLVGVFAMSTFHLASIPDLWSATMLMVASGFLVYRGDKVGDIDGESIDKNDKLSEDRRPIQPGELLEENIDVTIRLEARFLRYLNGPRCIVTIHSPAGCARPAGDRRAMTERS
jgi:hypothetical protein